MSESRSIWGKLFDMDHSAAGWLDEVEAITGVYVMVSPQGGTPSLRYRHELHLLWKRRTDNDFLLDFFARLDLLLVHVFPHHRMLLGRDHNGLCERWACGKDTN